MGWDMRLYCGVLGRQLDVVLSSFAGMVALPLYYDHRVYKGPVYPETYYQRMVIQCAIRVTLYGSH